METLRYNAVWVFLAIATILIAIVMVAALLFQSPEPKTFVVDLPSSVGVECVSVGDSVWCQTLPVNPMP